MDINEIIKRIEVLDPLVEVMSEEQRKYFPSIHHKSKSTNKIE